MKSFKIWEGRGGAMVYNNCVHLKISTCVYVHLVGTSEATSLDTAVVHWRGWRHCDIFVRFLIQICINICPHSQMMHLDCVLEWFLLIATGSSPLLTVST